MTYQFTCDKCRNTVDIEASMKEGPPSGLVCSGCGEPMRRVWTSFIQVPEHMRAESDFGDLRYKMAHAKRPSGKGRLYY
jgi:hypothetical protein